MPKTKPSISTLDPTERRLLLEEWMLTRHSTLWGRAFSMEENFDQAAEYFARQVEEFDEWLASRA